MSDKKSSASKALMDALMKLDGRVAVNIHEPTADDLPRMTNAYHDAMDKLTKALAALKFYADKNNWLREPNRDIAVRIDTEDCQEVSSYASFCGGKLARQTLEEIGE